MTVISSINIAPNVTMEYDTGGAYHIIDVRNEYEFTITPSTLRKIQSFIQYNKDTFE